MNINRIEIEGFGVWSRLKLADLSSKLTLIHGPNEAGKSTLMQFVRSMLYGASADRARKYLPPVAGGEAGGQLGFDAPHGGYVLRRRFMPPGAEGEAETIRLTDADGARCPAQLLEELMGGVDEPTFNNLFAVGLEEVQRLASLEDTAAADHLYRIAGGLDRVSLVATLRDLESARRALLDGGGEPTTARIPLLAGQLQQLDEKARAATRQTRQWLRLRQDRAALAEQIEAAEQDQAELLRKARLCETAIQMRDQWRQREQLEKKLKSLAITHRVSDEMLAELDDLNRRARGRLRQRAQLKEQIAAWRNEFEPLHVNRALLKHAARIEGLAEQEQWLRSLETESTELREKIAAMEERVASHRQALGMKAAGADSPAVAEGRDLAALLRGPAAAMRDCQARLSRAKAEVEAARQSQGDAARNLNRSLSAHGETDLTQALESTGRLVSTLRSRLQVGEKIEQLDRQRQELEGENARLSDKQVLSGPVLVGVGAVFILGVMLILTGIFGGIFALASSTAWGLVIGGGLCVGLAVGGKYVLELSAGHRQNDCQRELGRLRQQLNEAMEQRDQLDALIPDGGGPLPLRLSAAEKRLEQLEELLPLEAQAQVQADHTSDVEARLRQAGRDLKEARDRWAGELAAVGLPDDISPAKLRGLVGGWKRLSKLERALARRREMLKKNTEQLSVLTGRIDRIAADARLPALRGSASSRVSQIAATLAEQQQVAGKRRQLRRQARTAQLKLGHLRTAMHGLRQRRAELFALAGVGDEPSLRELADRCRRAAEIQSRLENLGREIDAARGGEFTEREIRDLLDHTEGPTLEKQLDDLWSRLEEADQNLKQMHEKRGELTHRIKSLAEDRTLGQTRLDLAATRAQLHEAAGRWRVLATAGAVMQSVRKQYETHRQPEVLKRASVYFEKLTCQKYRRVWTPLGQQELRVEDAHGEHLPIEVLSRGAREQLFLSLRLSLVEALAARGVRLPLVLDDVFVNFDNRRAAVAARVLGDFARQGHQVIVFTCHEHIVALFQELAADIRQLPARDGSVEPIDEPAAKPEPAKSRQLRRRRKPRKRAPVAEPLVAEPLAAEQPAEPPAAEPEPEPPPTEPSEPEPVKVAAPPPEPKPKPEPAPPPPPRPFDIKPNTEPPRTVRPKSVGATAVIRRGSGTPRAAWAKFTPPARPAPAPAPARTPAAPAPVTISPPQGVIEPVVASTPPPPPKPAPPAASAPKTTREPVVIITPAAPSPAAPSPAGPSLARPEPAYAVGAITVKKPRRAGSGNFAWDEPKIWWDQDKAHTDDDAA